MSPIIRAIRSAATVYPAPVQPVHTGQLLYSTNGVNGRETVNVVLASGATLTLPATTIAVGHDVSISANCTITLPASGSCWVRVRWPASPPGPYTLSFTGSTAAATIVWDHLPPPSGLPGKMTLYQFTWQSGTGTWKASYYGDLTYLDSASEYVNMVPTAGTAQTFANSSIAVGNDYTLSANCTLTLPAGERGGNCWAFVRQPTTGGVYTFTPTFLNPGATPHAVEWAAGTPPIQATGSGAVMLYQFRWDDVVGSWFGMAWGVGGGGGGGPSAVFADTVQAAFYMTAWASLNIPGGPTYAVPEGAEWATFTLIGAAGKGTYGGPGSYLQATIPVTSGDYIHMSPNTTSSGGGNSGGASPGGLAADVRLNGTGLANRVLVAAGGGGQATDASSSHGTGGSGGGFPTTLSGVSFPTAGGNGATGTIGGGPASASAGGAAGTGEYVGSAGALGVGAAGYNGSIESMDGGGGGDGLYGGGGGAGHYYSGGPAAGGGGGTDYVMPGAINVTDIPGNNSGGSSATFLGFSSSLPYTVWFNAASGSFQVPAGMTYMHVTAIGAAGGGPYGGPGSLVQAVIPVTPGQTVYANSGQKGAGNGLGGIEEYSRFGPPLGPGNGGPASDVRLIGNTLADRVIVAGGGGGQGAYPTGTYGAGGWGGGMNSYIPAGDGENASATLTSSGGRGADNNFPTANTPGAGGTGGAYPGASGSLGAGGSADQGDNYGCVGGGGGGDGYYGGGAGSSSAVTFPGTGTYPGAGGGGGGDYLTSAGTLTTNTPGANTGDGSVVITFSSTGSPAPLEITSPPSPSTTEGTSYSTTTGFAASSISTSTP